MSPIPGHGPPPKDPSKRARTNAGPREEGVLKLAPDGELRGPGLPAEGFQRMVKTKGDGPGVWETVLEQYDWPTATHRWYDNWRRSAIAQTFTPHDWDFLQETAVLHALFWLGDKSVAPEMRLRVSKFGATPEDRLRLRIDIDNEPTAGTPGQPEAPEPKARQRYGELRIVS